MLAEKKEIMEVRNQLTELEKVDFDDGAAALQLLEDHVMKHFAVSKEAKDVIINSFIDVKKLTDSCEQELQNSIHDVDTEAQFAQVMVNKLVKKLMPCFEAIMGISEYSVSFRKQHLERISTFAKFLMIGKFREEGGNII